MDLQFFNEKYSYEEIKSMSRNQLIDFLEEVDEAKMMASILIQSKDIVEYCRLCDKLKKELEELINVQK